MDPLLVLEVLAAGQRTQALGLRRGKQERCAGTRPASEAVGQVPHGTSPAATPADHDRVARRATAARGGPPTLAPARSDPRGPGPLRAREGGAPPPAPLVAGHVPD